MKCALILIAFALVAATSANPASSNAIVLRQRRDVDIFANTRRLIEELVRNLQASAQQAADAIGNFAAGLGEQVTIFRQQIEKSIQDLRDRVRQAVNNVTNRIQNISESVRACVEDKRGSSDGILNDTMATVGSCVDGQINRIEGLFTELTEVSNEALATGNEAVEQMRVCTEKHEGQLFPMGSCLSGVVFKTQGKTMGYAARSGVLISRINIAIGTLPSSLQLCAGARLLEAGARIGQVVVEVGRCAVSAAMPDVSG
nr:silk gland uncharacterized 11 [Tineola bisselliella]